MSDAQLVLAPLLDNQTSNLDDKKATLALAKERPAEVAAIGAAMGKSVRHDGRWG